jgi:hypothetical protein
MRKNLLFSGFLASFLAQFGIPAASAACDASSGATRTALVELYTSEGCSSCPPADRWLSGLRTRQSADAHLAPLAFHVDYWNRLGWVDRYAKPEYSARQRWMADINRARAIYTPQFVLDGRDWRPSRDAYPERPNRRSPGADLRLELGTASAGKLVVAGEARLRDRRHPAQLFLALYENGLSSRIAAGENAGSLLRHDFVVRQLIGPLDMPSTGALSFKQVFELAADWKRADLGLTAFVQNPASGEVHQALQRPLCTASGG